MRKMAQKKERLPFCSRFKNSLKHQILMIVPVLAKYEIYVNQNAALAQIVDNLF